MIKAKILIFIFLVSSGLLSGFEILAQVRCVTVEAEKQRKARYGFLPSEEEFENWMAKKIIERRNKLIPFGTSEEGDPDKIAVVVHVIYNQGDVYGQGTNISDEQILSQIEVLNEDFQRKNADTIKTQPEFIIDASKLNIEFVLARQTEGSDPSTGIMRVEGEKTSYNPLSISDRELLSSYSQWDPNLYLNIWVVNLSNSYIGLAQFPDYDMEGLEDEENKDNEATDGLVIDYEAFGSSKKIPDLELMPKYDLGRTTTHEMGHFFGLKHVWGDDTSVQGCSKDDYVGDTPFSNIDYSGLCIPSTHESCGTNDMFENYLNYTNDECMNIFTNGQVLRMVEILDYAPRRASLKNSIGTRYPDNMYFDLAIESISSPGKVSCVNEIQPIVEVKNNGTIPVTEFDIDYSIGDTKQSYTYFGDTIFTGEVISIDLNSASIQSGSYLLLVELTNIPDDINSSNNEMELAFGVDDQEDFIPLREQFEVADMASTNWISINEDSDIGWVLTNAPSTSDNNTSAYINFYNYESKQQLDWLISPSLDFSEAVEASVVFKTSYAKNQDFNDQLRIVVSKNCGNDFNDIVEVLYSSDLATTSSEDFWKPLDQTEWLSHAVDLSEYAGEESVRVAFLAVNDYGNNLYLDDIEFYTTAEENIVKTARNSFVVYPNPSSDAQVMLTFNTNERQNVMVYIYDSMGKIVTDNIYENTLNQTYYYDLTGYRSGVYFIHAIGEDFVRTKRLVLN